MDQCLSIDIKTLLTYIVKRLSGAHVYEGFEVPLSEVFKWCYYYSSIYRYWNDLDYQHWNVQLVLASYTCNNSSLTFLLKFQIVGTVQRQLSESPIIQIGPKLIFQ
jgi:hypothetical protein